MFPNFISVVSLLIINSLTISQGLFTRFMNDIGLPGTKSLLDYGLVDTDHSHTLTSFVIDENAHFSCGSDHALLECIIDLRKLPLLMKKKAMDLHYMKIGWRYLMKIPI
jgi:hypothetical protein